MDGLHQSPLTRKLSAFVALSAMELAVLQRLDKRRKSLVSWNAPAEVAHQLGQFFRGNTANELESKASGSNSLMWVPHRWLPAVDGATVPADKIRERSMNEPNSSATAETDNRRMKAVLLTAAAIAFTTAPLVTPFQGFDPQLFPAPQDDPPVQPAGYAFAIWGVIYMWLIVSAVFGLLASARDPEWDAPRWFLIGNLAVGAPWLAVAQTSAVWATVLIWVMLVTALLALFWTPSKDRWLLRAPVALYAGWLTAASWVAVGLLGAGYSLGPGANGWAIIGLTGALATAGMVQRRLQNIPMYVAAVVWALIGVAVANFGDAWGLSALALAGAAALTFQALRGARG